MHIFVLVSFLDVVVLVVSNAVIAFRLSLYDWQFCFSLTFNYNPQFTEADPGF
jgi:hypothetical protein